MDDIMLSFKAYLFRRSGLTKVALVGPEHVGHRNGYGHARYGHTRANPGSKELAINLNTSEIIMVDLDTLEDNPDELLNVLTEGQSSVYVWTQLVDE